MPTGQLSGREKLSGFSCVFAGASLTSILIETDSPVLGPLSGERNDLANLLFAVESISDIMGLSENAVREAACENTLRLYGGQFAQGEQRDV